MAPLCKRTPGGAWKTFDEKGLRCASNSILMFPALENHSTCSPGSSTTTSGSTPTITSFSATQFLFIVRWIFNYRSVAFAAQAARSTKSSCRAARSCNTTLPSSIRRVARANTAPALSGSAGCRLYDGADGFDDMPRGDSEGVHQLFRLSRMRHFGYGDELEL